jgi:hypothetical protein
MTNKVRSEGVNAVSAVKHSNITKTGQRRSQNPSVHSHVLNFLYADTRIKASTHFYPVIINNHIFFATYYMNLAVDIALENYGMHQPKQIA